MSLLFDEDPPALVRFKHVALTLLRVVSGFLLFQAGAMKLFGWYGGMPGGGTVPIAGQMGVGAVLEVVCGALIVVGLLTRPMAFLMSGQMAVAYWQFHFPHGFWPAQNHGQPAALLCFIFLYLAASGGGPWSVDALVRRRRSG